MELCRQEACDSVLKARLWFFDRDWDTAAEPRLRRASVVATANKIAGRTRGSAARLRRYPCARNAPKVSGSPKKRGKLRNEPNGVDAKLRADVIEGRIVRTMRIRKIRWVRPPLDWVRSEQAPPLELGQALRQTQDKANSRKLVRRMPESLMIWRRCGLQRACNSAACS